MDGIYIYNDFGLMFSELMFQLVEMFHGLWLILDYKLITIPMEWLNNWLGIPSSSLAYIHDLDIRGLSFITSGIIVFLFIHVWNTLKTAIPTLS